MGNQSDSKVDRLINHFLEKMSEQADPSDWKEADGWVGKWTITGKTTRSYEVRGGRLCPTTEQESYTGQVEMSEDTFIDLIQAAMRGNIEEVFAQKYGRSHIIYKGEQWIVDSERFRKILRKAGKQ